MVPNEDKASVPGSAGVRGGAGGCGLPHGPGRPKPGAEAERPDQVVDFPHAVQGELRGVSRRSRAERAQRSHWRIRSIWRTQEQTIFNASPRTGVPGTLMPAFAKSKGGMLTDQQMEIMVNGMLQSWGKPVSGQPMPAFEPQPAGAPTPAPANGAATRPAPGGALNQGGDATQGQVVFTQFCARCHGADGNGNTAAGGEPGSLLDPAYLALISDGRSAQPDRCWTARRGHARLAFGRQWFASDDRRRDYRHVAWHFLHSIAPRPQVRCTGQQQP